MDNIQFLVAEMSLMSTNSVNAQHKDDKKNAVSVAGMKALIAEIIKLAQGKIEAPAVELEKLAAYLSDFEKDTKAIQEDLKIVKSGTDEQRYHAFYKLMGPGGDLATLRKDTEDFHAFMDDYADTHKGSTLINIMKGLPPIDLSKILKQANGCIDTVMGIHGEHRGTPYDIDKTWRTIRDLDYTDPKDKARIDTEISCTVRQFLNDPSGPKFMDNWQNISGALVEDLPQATTGAQKRLTQWSQVLQILMKIMENANTLGGYFAQHGTSN